ncbi:MAG: hypothetical protein WCY41_03240 [Candidatus Micrarchaeia archaeon]
MDIVSVNQFILRKMPNPVMRLEATIRGFPEKMDNAQLVRALRQFKRAKTYCEWHQDNVSWRELILRDDISNIYLRQRVNACKIDFIKGIEASPKYALAEPKGNGQKIAIQCLPEKPKSPSEIYFDELEAGRAGKKPGQAENGLDVAKGGLGTVLANVYMFAKMSGKVYANSTDARNLKARITAIFPYTQYGVRNENGVQNMQILADACHADLKNESRVPLEVYARVEKEVSRIEKLQG